MRLPKTLVAAVLRVCGGQLRNETRPPTPAKTAPAAHTLTRAPPRSPRTTSRRWHTVPAVRTRLAPARRLRPPPRRSCPHRTTPTAGRRQAVKIPGWARTHRAAASVAARQRRRASRSNLPAAVRRPAAPRRRNPLRIVLPFLNRRVSIRRRDPSVPLPPKVNTRKARTEPASLGTTTQPARRRSRRQRACLAVWRRCSAIEGWPGSVECSYLNAEVDGVRLGAVRQDRQDQLVHLR